MPGRIHEGLAQLFPEFAGALARRPDEPYLVEHVLPAASDADIRVLEDALRVPLPNSYKSLLRLCRGFWLSGGMVQLGPEHPFFHDFPPLERLSPQQRSVVRQRGGSWPPPSQGMLCFAEYFVEADGDQALWDVRQGLQDGEYPVYYYAHEGRPASVRRIASSFGEWLGNCLDPFPPDEEDP
jgi:hypothetical protein